MGLENLVLGHPVVIKEAVRALGLVPGAAGLGDGGGGLLAQLLGNLDKALDQAAVPQGGAPEFFLGPTAGGILRQTATPPRLGAECR